MDSLSRAERYVFFIALAMIVLVYWAGLAKLIQVGGPQLINLDYAATGRTPQGTFPNYAGNQPAV